jgi:hypothetical protein
VNTHLIRTPLRALLAGLVLVASAVVLALVGGVLGVPEPWPVLLVAGAGLLVGVPRIQHGLALVVGATIGLGTAWLDLAHLPDATVGVAVAVGTAVLLITVVTLASRGWLRFGLQLVGWAVMTALAGPLVAAEAPSTTGAGPLLRTYVTVLIAAGLGLLVAQVAQLLATAGTARRSSRSRRGVRGAGVVGLVLATGLAAAPPVAQADSDPFVQHQQLIVLQHSADGTPRSGTVLTRVGTSGAGQVRLELRDQAVAGLRNLDGFGTPEVRGDRITIDLADGSSLRTVADLARPLPVAISVAYVLDGEPIPPAALVGRSGSLEVTYTLENRTVEPREIRYSDAGGRTRTVTRDVAVPFAGLLSVALDDRFDLVRADRGRVSLDRGGSPQLWADLVLFAPVGAPVQTVTWTAEVRDAIVPAVHVELVPVGVGDLAARDAEAARSDAFLGVLRDLAVAGELLRTRLRTLEPDSDAGLAELFETLAVAAAGVGETRALLTAHEQRRIDGDGLVHGLLVAGPELPRGTRVDTGAVYVLAVQGLADDGGPSLPLRSGLALGLLGVVGLLGRAVGTLTEGRPEGRAAHRE